VGRHPGQRQNLIDASGIRVIGVTLGVAEIARVARALPLADASALRKENGMKRMIPILTMSALVLSIAGVACSRGRSPSADSSLARDLSLAAHQRDSLDSVSAVESQRIAARPKHVYRADDDPRPYASHPSGASTATAAGDVSRTAPSARPGDSLEKHTQRDAAIGAATGAVIGAVASRSKVKGGLMGAAVGGIVGAVIGNNVDKTKKKP
jgi:Glycine zipper